MTDITRAVEYAIRKLVDSGSIEEVIEKKIAETVSRLIEEQLSSYSPFGKAVNEKIKEALSVDYERVSIPAYNAMIADVVVRKVHEYVATTGVANIEETLGAILKPAPKQIKLSEIIEKFKEDVVERFDYDPEKHTKITVYFDDAREHWDSRWIYLDREADTKKYECEFSFLINCRGNIAFLRFKGRNTKEDVFIGGYYGFERVLFDLHAAQTKVEIDSYDEYLPEVDSDDV